MSLGEQSSARRASTLFEYAELCSTVDEAALGRLRRAIAVEDGDEEELQLHGVLRMLGAEAPGGKQMPLFGKASARPGRNP